MGLQRRFLFFLYDDPVILRSPRFFFIFGQFFFFLFPGGARKRKKRQKQESSHLSVKFVAQCGWSCVVPLLLRLPVGFHCLPNISRVSDRKIF